MCSVSPKSQPSLLFWWGYGRKRYISSSCCYSFQCFCVWGRGESWDIYVVFQFWTCLLPASCLVWAQHYKRGRKGERESPSDKSLETVAVVVVVALMMRNPLPLLLTHKNYIIYDVGETVGEIERERKWFLAAGLVRIWREFVTVHLLSPMWPLSLTGKHSLLLFLPLSPLQDIQLFFLWVQTLFYFVWSRFISLYHDDDKCMVIHVHFVAWICVWSCFVSGKYSNWVHLAMEMSHRIFIEIPSAITKREKRKHETIFMRQRIAFTHDVLDAGGNMCEYLYFSCWMHVLFYLWEVEGNAWYGMHLLWCTWAAVKQKIWQ